MLWPLFVVLVVLMVFFTFTMLANIIAAPFNGFLAEKVEVVVHGHGRQADGRCRHPDIDVDKRQADTHCECVDAGGKRGDRENQERMLTGFFLFLVFVFEAVVDHVQAEDDQQGEGDPVVPLATQRVAAWPISQPMIGVMASITPKIRPVRRASVRRGLCRLEPLPMAAANASVDMARARNMRETGFTGAHFQSGYESTTQPHARL